MNYEQAFHDGTVSGEAEERRAIVEWLNAIPEYVLDDWGMNAASEIASYVEAGIASEGAPYWAKRVTEDTGMGPAQAPGPAEEKK